MSHTSLRDRGSVTTADRGREFWPGVGEHEARISDELVSALRRVAHELALPLSSVLLTAHAKVLGVLSGEREVSTGYAVAGRPPLPCRMTTGPHSWRALLLETRRAESGLLSHRDFPVDDLRREPGLTTPLLETVFEVTAHDGRRQANEIALWVGFLEHDNLVLR